MIVYTGIFVDKDELVKKFKPAHPNVYAHHMTIEYKPKSIAKLLIGKKMTIKIVARLITDRIDVLLVDAPKRNAHITLSCAKGVKPFESNQAIEKHFDKVVYLNQSIVYGTVGYFNGKQIIKHKIK